MCFHCEDTGLLEIQILLCFTTAYLQVDPEKMDHIKHLIRQNWGIHIRYKSIAQLSSDTS